MRDPHGAIPPLLGGVALDAAPWAMILVHGRGGTPEGMLPIARAAGATDAALIAPRADGMSWYPHRFLAPTSDNQPWLSSALGSIARAVQTAADAGVPRERVLLVGFSQGACLSLEFIARAAQQDTVRFGGVAAFAGALIGDDAEQTRAMEGSLAGTPIFLSVGDADEHIPVDRVRASAALFDAAGATTDTRIYPGVGHSIVGDQMYALRDLIVSVQG